MPNFESTHAAVPLAEFSLDVRWVHLDSVMRTARASRKRDLDTSKSGEQGGENATLSDFSSRLRNVMDGPPKVTPADLGRIGGFPPQSIHRWRNGAAPDPATALALADALDVDFRWLATGEGRQKRTHTEDDWVTLPHLDLFAFSDGHKPLPNEEVRVKREWLGRVRVTTGLWLTDMPSDGSPDIGREGDTLVCVDPIPPLVDGRTYILLVGSSPLVRRLRMLPDGTLELRTGGPDDAPSIISPQQVEDLSIIGRVVASIALRSI